MERNDAELYMESVLFQRNMSILTVTKDIQFLVCDYSNDGHITRLFSLIKDAQDLNCIFIEIVSFFKGMTIFVCVLNAVSNLTFENFLEIEILVVH